MFLFGEKQAHDASAKEHHHNQIKAGDDKVVAGYQQEKMFGKIDGFGHGSQVGDAADVDACHHGTDFGKVCGTYV